MLKLFPKGVISVTDSIENLKIIGSMHKASRKSAKIENRPTNSFIIRINGKCTYKFGDKAITVNEGEMMFLPKGITYEYVTEGEDKSFYTSINFLGDIGIKKPKAYSLTGFHHQEYISNNFADLWKFGLAPDKYKCMSMFYDLVSFVLNIENAEYSHKKKFEVIEPAVAYLKDHIYDCNLKTDKLHRICGVSDTYFRKIFVLRFGISPQNYIISKRLVHAKSIIDSGDYDTIGEVAESVGYSDPLYFGKAFKKMYGYSPSASGK